MPANLEEIEKEVALRLSPYSERGTLDAINIESGSYKQFKLEDREAHTLNTFFEKYCMFAYGYLSFIKLGEKTSKKMNDDLEICGLTNITPESVLAGSVFTILLSLFATLPLIVIGWKDVALFIVFVGLFLSYVGYTYPGFYAQIIKIRAQEESILAILYMTIYMRVNPVLENSLYFATQHLNGPLGKDLKNLLWLVDMQKAESIEEASKQFMDLWLKRNPDFIKSFLTLHSIVLQPDQSNREKILEKALSTILDSTYIKMKHYSHDLQMPVMMLHTFGMMLPLIGLIAFPMLSIFMADSVRIDYLFFGYLVVLPCLLWFFTNRIISKRPGAFSYPDLTGNPYLPPEGKYLLRIGDKSYLIPVLKVAVVVGLLIMIPGIVWVVKHTIPAYIITSKAAEMENVIGADLIPKSEYTTKAMFNTMTIPMGISAMLIIYFYGRSIQKLKVRNAIVEIESDLDEALFQMGNQFTEEIPIEVALKKYLQGSQMLNLKKRSIFKFFREVMDRIEDEGKTFVQAVFDKAEGTIIKYPSILMKEIMWIIVEGTSKGAKVLYNIMTKISVYLGNTKKIKELIYDLLTGTVTSINVQAKFFTPFLAAVVGSLTLIIVQTLYALSQRLERIMAMLQLNMGDTTNFFQDLIKFTEITPPTVFQILVGLYMVETVILLSILANGVQSGFDKVSRDITISKNLFYSILVYVALTLIGVTALNALVETGIASTGV